MAETKRQGRNGTEGTQREGKGREGKGREREVKGARPGGSSEALRSCGAARRSPGGGIGERDADEKRDGEEGPKAPSPLSE